MGKKILALVLFAALAVPVFAEHEFALSLSPAFEIPAGKEHFGAGMGAAAGLDWAFLPFMGISSGGGFSGLSTEAGSSLTLYRGGLGPFFRWRPFDRWTFRVDLRAGLYQYQWEDYSNTRPFAGGGLRAEFHLSPFLSLYAGGEYVVHAFSESALNTFNLTAGIRLDLSEIMRGQARVRGEKIEQHRIFPVSYAWYRDNPAATVRITNNEPNTITGLQLSLFMDSYMGQPEPFAIIPSLAPGESADVPVTALFNEVMLSLTENVNANGQVLISYQSLGARKETDFPLQMPVYHRNALSWDDDRRAASFVSARDPAARLFARYVASAADRIPEEGPAENGLPQNVRYAIALFEALAAYGINYVIDPASSFVELSGDASALDSLNYPYQTLYYRGGDCDDLSILYCSLLEILGIDTAFITIPGHIYMAFDTGSETWRDGLIERGGRFWMPVEITVPGEGFYEAYRIGAREWRRFASQNPPEFLQGENSTQIEGEAKLYPMRESWAIYPPVTVPEAGDYLPPVPEEQTFAAALEREIKKLAW
ncbi:MAG: hypothetical protein LBH73_02995 [Spirochaetaceae bacterium]|jgi:transglutaminase-like putative cysteine protease|nr:hypothetical protein [Spirochaetaceae bacterium]